MDQWQNALIRRPPGDGLRFPRSAPAWIRKFALVCLQSLSPPGGCGEFRSGLFVRCTSQTVSRPEEPSRVNEGIVRNALCAGPPVSIRPDHGWARPR